jgi:hypothetical protein
MTDPIRLADDPDLPPDLRSALRLESRRKPPAALRAAVWTGVSVSTGLTSATAAGAAAADLAGASAALPAPLGVKATLVLLLKWLAVGVGVGGSLAVGLHVLAPEGGDSPRPVPSVADVSTPLPPIPPAAASTVAAADDPERPTPHAPMPPLVSADAPPTGTAPGAPGAALQKLATASSSKLSQTDPEHVGPTAGTLPTVSSSLARDEAARVAGARELLRRGDGQTCLNALASLDRDVPGGLLMQERQALRVEALSATGRTAEARRAAEAFLLRYPESPHAARVRSWREGAR